MYTVLVGPPGKCRKGTAMTPGYRMLRTLGIKIAAESTTREALIRELKTSSYTDIDPMTGAMNLHASLTIYSQELTVFLGYNNLQLMSDLVDWYDCREQWTYRTKNMGTDDIVGVWVNLFGATTPELIATTMPRDAIGGGLTSRMIFVYEYKKGRSCPTPFLSRDEKELEKALIQDLEKISMMSGEFKVTEEVLERWVEWYTETDKSPPPFDDHRFAGYFERRPTHILKLSMILSSSRSSSRVIEMKDFERAIEILKSTEIRMPFTFSGMGKSPVSDIMQRIMGVLAMSRKMSLGELQSRFYADVDKYALSKIVETMESMEYIEVEHAGGEKYITYVDKRGLMDFNR